MFQFLIAATLSLTLLSCAKHSGSGNDSKNYVLKGEGIEECVNQDHTVYSVAHRHAGVDWFVNFQGKTYQHNSMDFAYVPESQTAVQFGPEKITHTKCHGFTLLERESLRKISIFNQSHKLIYKGEVMCKGYAPNGLALMPAHFNLCPRRH